MRQVIKLFGSKEKLENLIYELNPDISPFYIYSDCLDTWVEFEDVDEAELMDLLDGLEEYVYSEEENTLEETFVRFLESNDVHIATAESCTGGMVASSLINVSGASNVFFEGLVTYSNEAKINRLEVSPLTLETHGAVSEETAKEMALGLLSDNVDFGISTTGIAGPTGGTIQKPVGLVYIGLAYKGYPPVAYRFVFDGDRKEIRTSAKNAALFKAWKYLENIL